LIAVEIVTDLWGLHRESIEFDRQQTVLTSLEKSAAATADALIALRKTMDGMNTAAQSQLSRDTRAPQSAAPKTHTKKN
jgi:hypothetical protein